MPESVTPDDVAFVLNYSIEAQGHIMADFGAEVRELAQQLIIVDESPPSEEFSVYFNCDDEDLALFRTKVAHCLWHCPQRDIVNHTEMVSVVKFVDDHSRVSLVRQYHQEQAQYSTAENALAREHLKLCCRFNAALELLFVEIGVFEKRFAEQTNMFFQ